MSSLDQLRIKLSEKGLVKLLRIENPKFLDFVAEYIALLNPATVYVCDDSAEDNEYIKAKAIEMGEEKPLKLQGHTVHFDAYGDQGRDRKNTKILLEGGADLGVQIDTGDRETYLRDVKEIMTGIMGGKELIIRFFCLGPVNSKFSIPCVQLTDSYYVAHSESLLYRTGYEEMVRQAKNDRYFRFIHSAGEVDPVTKVSVNLDKRRMFIDRDYFTVYSANTQYGGNTLGLKKLAMRLAIYLGSKEGWLNEHMLVMGVHGPAGRVTYFTGAFPSMCGKTSTSMMEGESIIGDDIAYLRIENDEVRACNTEKGMFGIIQGVNSTDDPQIFAKIQEEGTEIIFSNVLVKEDGDLYWIGKDGEVPEKGWNHAGAWTRGMVDSLGKEIKCSHPNARFTLSLDQLKNVDPNLENPDGVKVGGVVYGGRDSDTWNPVEQAFSWED